MLFLGVNLMLKFWTPFALPDKPDLTKWWYFEYGAPNPPQFDCLKIQQKDHVIYSGVAPGHFLDACSKVPFIKETGVSEEVLSDVLLTRTRDQWQREINSRRAAEIGSWWSSQDTNILNPVILSMNPTAGFTETTVTASVSTPTRVAELVTLQPTPWTTNYCPDCTQYFNMIISTNTDLRTEVQTAVVGAGGTYDPTTPVFMDQCCNPACDRYGQTFTARPFDIPDGQHRLRGTQTANAGSFSETPLLFTLMPSERFFDPAPRPNGGFTQQQAAQVFTDVNIRPVALNENHKLTMAWRFSMSRASIYGDVYDFSSSTGRAAKSYEAILHATNSTFRPNLWNNPLFGKVRLLSDDENTNNALFKLETLFKAHVFPKTDAGKPWARASSADIADALIEYLKAIRATWPGPNASGEPYWAPTYGLPPALGSPPPIANSEILTPATAARPATYHGVISHRSKSSDGQTGALRVLMNIYDDVHFEMTAASLPTPFSDTDIATTLAPLNSLDWSVLGGGELGISFLTDVCVDVIRGGNIAGMLADANLLTRLGLPSPCSLNELVSADTPWSQHPRTTSGTPLPRIAGGGALLDESNAPVAAPPALAMADDISVLHPMNVGPFKLTVQIASGAMVLLESRNKGSAQLQFQPGRATAVARDGLISMQVRDIEAAILAESLPAPATGDILTLSLDMKTQLGSNEIQQFQFEWP
jgi:hypothetical protein